MNWELSYRADPKCVPIADRHYNRQKAGSPQFVPPGSCLVLRHPNALWVTSFPLEEYTKHAWAGAWVNSTFRNEGSGILSSQLILEAVSATRWWYGDPPQLGMITFVDALNVRHKRDPGRCYVKAGFKRVGKTKGGLLALQLLPNEMPDPEPALSAQFRLIA